jgi:hypothetical protein
MDIHKETGIPLEQLTSDGISIPAARPRAASQQGTASSSVTTAPAKEVRQSDMSAADFFGAAAYTSFNRWGNVNTTAVTSPQTCFAGSLMEDVVMDNPGTLFLEMQCVQISSRILTHSNPRTVPRLLTFYFSPCPSSYCTSSRNFEGFNVGCTCTLRIHCSPCA